MSPYYLLKLSMILSLFFVLQIESVEVNIEFSIVVRVVFSERAHLDIYRYQDLTRTYLIYEQKNMEKQDIYCIHLITSKAA